MGPDFEILGEISQVETIAKGKGVRDRARLRRAYGGKQWRKCKGVARVRLPNGMVRVEELHWYEAHGVGRVEFQDKALTPAMAKKHLVVCIDNEGYPASLERWKLYVSIPDPDAEKDGLIRVIDESGEDYLFSKARFRSADALPQSVKKAVLASAA